MNQKRIAISYKECHWVYHRWAISQISCTQCYKFNMMPIQVVIGVHCVDMWCTVDLIPTKYYQFEEVAKCIPFHIANFLCSLLPPTTELDVTYGVHILACFLIKLIQFISETVMYPSVVCIYIYSYSYTVDYPIVSYNSNRK